MDLTINLLPLLFAFAYGVSEKEETKQSVLVIYFICSSFVITAM